MFDLKKNKNNSLYLNFIFFLNYYNSCYNIDNNDNDNASINV